MYLEYESTFSMLLSPDEHIKGWKQNNCKCYWI